MPEELPLGAIVARAYQAAGLVDRSLLVSDRGEPASAKGFHIPYTGWVGSKFVGGTVVIAKNPGGRGDELPTDSISIELDRRLAAFSSSSRPLTELRDITELYLAQTSIGMHRILADIERELGEERESLAYLNPCPYRTPGGLRMKACLQLVALPLLQALRPDTIIVLNKTIGGDIEDLERRGLWATPDSVRWTYTLQRYRKDELGLAPEGLAALSVAARDNAARRTHRVAAP